MTQASIPKSIRAGEMARICGVSADTLRYYERLGLLPRPPRTPGGYRLYAVESIIRVRLIRRALGIGFTLAELAQILRVRDRGGAPCREVAAIARQKLEQLECRLAEQTALRDRLRILLSEWDRKLSGTPEGVRAGLLEALTIEPEPTDRRKENINETAGSRARNNRSPQRPGHPPSTGRPAGRSRDGVLS